jgi:hypothetical protein
MLRGHLLGQALHQPQFGKAKIFHVSTMAVIRR